jgi:hypothetical protein
MDEEPLAYPLFHQAVLAVHRATSLNLGTSSVVVLTGAVVLSGVILFLVLREQLSGLYSWPIIAMATTTLFFMAAVDPPSFCPSRYLCYGSPNSVHNPTILIAKPFALLSLILFHHLVTRQEGPSLPLAAVTTLVLVIGAFAKPSFGLALILSAPLFLWLNRRGLNGRRELGLAFAPLIGLVAVIALQYVLTYEAGAASDDDAGIVLDILGVAGLYSPNPILSMVLLSAFPIATLLSHPVLWRDRLVSLTLMTFLVAVAQYWMLAEQGSRYAHGNFGWGVESVLPLLFALCLGDLLRRLRVAKSPLQRVISFLLVAIFLAHLVSGALYTIQLLTTDSFA